MTNAEEVFRKLLDNIARQLNYKNYSLKVEPISSGGANYTSTLFVAVISAPEKKELQLFGKVASVADSLRTTFMDEVFKLERYFYTDLINIFKDLERKHDIPEEHRLITAKCYGSNSDDKQETIVLENVLAAGYKLYDRMKSMTWEYAAKAVEVLAKFHALSLAYSLESPDKFKKIRCLDYTSLAFQDSNIMEIFRKQITNGPFKVIKSENEEKLRRYIDGSDRVTELLECYKPISRPVLVHGDYRVSNLMYRCRNDKIVIIPVDFQTLHLGCPVYDLMYLIYLGSDAKFRKLHYKDLLEHYYNELKLALKRLNVDINYVYPRKYYDGDLDALKMVGLLLSVTTLPVVTVNEQEAPELGLDMEFEPSEVFRERFNEIVDEYVDRGLLK